jgi:Spy/CpxP family protein refolding chaperone
MPVTPNSNQPRKNNGRDHRLRKIKFQSSILIPILMLISLLLGLAVHPVPAFNSGSRGNRGFNQGNKSTENKFLNLTPGQEDQLQGLRDKFLEETSFLRTEIARRLLELRLLWTAPVPDKEQVSAKKKEIIDLYAQLQMKATDNRLLAQGFLSPKQAEKLPVLGLHLETEPGFASGPRAASWN